MRLHEFLDIPLPDAPLDFNVDVEIEVFHEHEAGVWRLIFAPACGFRNWKLSELLSTAKSRLPNALYPHHCRTIRAGYGTFTVTCLSHEDWKILLEERKKECDGLHDDASF